MPGESQRVVPGRLRRSGERSMYNDLSGKRCLKHKCQLSSQGGSISTSSKIWKAPRKEDRIRGRHGGLVIIRFKSGSTGLSSTSWESHFTLSTQERKWIWRTERGEGLLFVGLASHQMKGALPVVTMVSWAASNSSSKTRLRRCSF